MIKYISLFGTSISLYYLFWLIGAVTTLLVGCWTAKYSGLNLSKSILYNAIDIIMGYIIMWVTALPFGGDLRLVRISYLLPLTIYLEARIFGDSFTKVLDFLAPLVVLFFGVTHFGCVFPGCCQGYPSDWGLYSNVSETICFPIQIIEAISNILISIILIVMQKRGIQQGKLYAWFMLLFGTTRFVWEFFRDNEKIWNGISELAVHALATAVIGLVAIIILNTHSCKKEVQK